LSLYLHLKRAEIRRNKGSGIVKTVFPPRCQATENSTEAGHIRRGSRAPYLSSGSYNKIMEKGFSFEHMFYGTLAFHDVSIFGMSKKIF
jgi:hypothetical protein